MTGFFVKYAILFVSEAIAFEGVELLNPSLGSSLKVTLESPMCGSNDLAEN